MSTSGELLGSIPQQFPQSSRPLYHSYDDTNNTEYSIAAEKRFSDQYFDDVDEENWRSDHHDDQSSGGGSRFLDDHDDYDDDDDNLLPILRGFVGKGHLFKKNGRIERAMRKGLHDLIRGRLSCSEVLEMLLEKLNSEAGRDDGSGVEQRNINGDHSSISELKHKLQRFKVKTVNVAGVGVVKEEQN